jgi:Gram-negative bacterial TonB protein C-terminal
MLYAEDMRDAAPAFLCGWSRAALIAIWLAVSSSGQPGPSLPPLLDEGIEVLHFERMPYPLYAKVRSIGGVVVLRAAIGSEGRVTDVTALSGPKALLEEPAENLKKWRFGSAKQGAAIVVYWFQFRGLCEAPCPSAFEFYPPNLAVITAGHQVVTP